MVVSHSDHRASSAFSLTRSAPLTAGPASHLPWLKAPVIALFAILTCLPFALVALPPLIDLPGHIAAASIENAAPTSSIKHYFEWRWAFSFNLGGVLLLKALVPLFGPIRAGWICAVCGVFLLAVGCLAMIRAVNPRGGYGVGWAMIFVYSYPVLWGFLNFIIAEGLALCACAVAIGLQNRPRWQAVFLVAAQPTLLICHAIGGILLPVLFGAFVLGQEIDRRLPQFRQGVGKRALCVRIGAEWIRRCWPLLASLITVAVWRLTATGPGEGIGWWWRSKADAPLLVLRDQSMILDLTTALMSIVLVFAASLLGAKWTFRGSLPGLSVLAIFLLGPFSIGHSYMIDSRLLPVGIMLLLGLQDWSGPRIRAARIVGIVGGALFLTRLAVTTASFPVYAQTFDRNLAATTHIAPGSRVLAFVNWDCWRSGWRLSRLYHISSLVVPLRGAWVNDIWAVPGLDMVQTRLRPGRYYTSDPSQFLTSPKCLATPGVHNVDSVIRNAPIEKVDYLWFIETGPPSRPDRRLRLVWRDGESTLFAVNHLGF